jgi:CheY-like chemotaxis protein
MFTVLVVDDDYDLLDSLAEALALEGFDVRTAHDGADAFAKLARGPLPDAILLDLGMPHMTGWKFREVQKRHGALARIPVVVMTGSRPIGLDAEGVLEKPFTVPAIAAMLRAVIAAASSAPDAEPARCARAGSPLPARAGEDEELHLLHHDRPLARLVS